MKNFVISLLKKMVIAIFAVLVSLAIGVAFVLTVLLALAIIAVVVYLLSLAGILFIQPKEGTIVAIVISNKLDHFIMVWQGHRLNDPRLPNYDPSIPAWEVIDLPPQEANEVPSCYKPGSFWRLFELFGIYWIGIPPYRVYEYEFTWSEIQKDEETGLEKPWHRSAKTNFIYALSFVYWAKAEEAEDADGVPLDLEYLLTVRTRNPNKALFGIGDWLTRVTAVSNSRAKQWVGSRTFKEITAERDGIRENDPSNQSSFNGAIVGVDPNTGALLERQEHGVVITEAALQKVTITGPNAAALSAATTKRMVATADAAAFEIETSALANRQIKLGEAERDRVNAYFDAVLRHGDQGVLLRQLEALVEASKGEGKLVVWANNPFLQTTRSSSPQNPSEIQGILQQLNMSPADALALLQQEAGRRAATSSDGNNNE